MSGGEAAWGERFLNSMMENMMKQSEEKHHIQRRR